MYVQFHITDCCNLKCLHCYNKDAPRATMNIDNFRLCVDKIVDYILDTEGTLLNSKICLIGGEPLMLPDFIDYLRYCVDKFGRVVIATNGILLNNELCNIFRMYNVRIQVSIDGDKEVNDYIRGEGVYKKVLRNVKMAVSNGVDVVCSYTLNSKNIDSFFGFYKDVDGKGLFNWIWFDRMIPIQNTIDVGVCSKEQFKEFLEVCRSINDGLKDGRYSQSIMIDRALFFLSSDENCSYRCSIGRNITVTPVGELLSCRRLPIVIGNIYKDSLKSVFESVSVCRLIEKSSIVPDECKLCRYSESCKGGSKCMQYALNNRICGKDPHCPLEVR